MSPQWLLSVRYLPRLTGLRLTTEQVRTRVRDIFGECIQSRVCIVYVRVGPSVSFAKLLLHCPSYFYLSDPVAMLVLKPHVKSCPTVVRQLAMKPGFRQAIGDAIAFHPLVRVIHLFHLRRREVNELGIVLYTFFVDTLGNDGGPALHDPRQKDVGDGAVVMLGDASKHFMVEACASRAVGEWTEKQLIDHLIEAWPIPPGACERTSRPLDGYPFPGSKVP
jgi:hypothetical protein